MSSTKTPTLDSFRKTDVDVPEFPRAYEDGPDEFYEMLYSECEMLGQALIDTLPVTRTDSGYVINFDQASFTDYEDAIATAPDIVLQGLVSACHMTERIVREHDVDVPNLYRYADVDATIRGEKDIQAFISRGCLQYLTGETPLETVLFLYFRSQERNRIQHARGAFYEDVHDILKANDFTVTRDSSLPGRPNLVIGRVDPPEFTENAVVGKALRAKGNDVSKRARHAATCCGELASEMPGATRVVVFRVTGDPFPNDRVRAKIRAKIMNQNPDAIDAVFFQDEFDEFVEFCDENITVFGETKDTPGARAETHESLDEW
jgi:hypothetical protein